LLSPVKYSEEELVMLLQQKDKQAFSYLYDHYAPALNTVIFRMVNDNALAEDILQEVFVKIWNHLSDYDKYKGRLFTWMLNIAKNHSIDTLRSKGYQKQQKISSDENSVHMMSDGGAAARRSDTIGLRKQLFLLKPEYRELIELAYFSGYTQDEIAKQTGIPLGTVKTRLRTAIIELKKILRPS